MSAMDFRTKLASLCETSSTGTMFLVTESQRQARIGLSAGRIIHLGMRPLSGIAALATIATTAFSGFRFQEGDAPDAHADLPPTPVILSMFQSVSAQMPADGPQTAPPTPAQAAPQTAPQAAAKAAALVASFAESHLQVVEKQLIEHFGPIAKVLIDEQRTQCRTLDELFSALAPNFDSAQEAAQFAATVKKRLGL